MDSSTNNRDQSGKFAKGNPGGPGRKKGSLNFLTICRERAEAEGIDLDTKIWELVKVLIEKAKEGCATSAKIVLDRLCGPVEKGPTVEVQVNTNRQPVPDNEGLGEWLEALNKVARENGVLPDDR